MNWNEIWNTIKTFFQSNVWTIVGFFATLIIGLVLLKIILNITSKVMKKTKMQEVTQGFLYHILKFVLYLILILILLDIIGISMSGVVTAISAAVLAIGMALQNIIANLANGIIIVSTGMFKKGDYISVSGVEGSLIDVNFLFCTIITTDNKRVTIPNSTILNDCVTNYGANPTRRVDFSFDVAYESDVEVVKKVVLDVMHSNGKVMLEPKAPFCRLKYLNANAITFVANCWVDAEDYWDVYYYVMENVFNEFKRKGITIPYAQLEIRERKETVSMPVIGKGLPEREEKVRTEKKKSIDLEHDNLLKVFAKTKKEKPEKESKNKTKSA